MYYAPSSLYTFRWSEGDYDEECSFDIYVGNDLVYSTSSCSKFTEGQIVFTYCGHVWQDATCTLPRTCSVCQTTEGEALGHDWEQPYCVTTKTCTRCSATEEAPAYHDWKGTSCCRCGKASEIYLYLYSTYSGWNGNVLEIYADGVFVKRVYCSGSESTFTIEYDTDKVYTFVWQRGYNPEMCIFDIHTVQNGQVFLATAATCSTFTTGQTVYTLCYHNWQEVTCTTAKTCTRCHATEGEALGHAWDSDCDIDCATCGEVREAPHAWDNGCDTECNNSCGYIRETTHAWTDADCVTPKTCSECGATEGEALGHTEVTDEAVEPDCTNTGLTEGSHCETCGTTLIAQETVGALGHTPKEAVQENLVPETCVADGSYDAVVYCEVCETEVSREAKVLTATGVHDYSIVTSRKEPTCTASGYVMAKCSMCSAPKKTTVPALGHRETTLTYKESVLTLDTLQAASLKNSTYIDVIGTEEILYRVDNIAQIAADANVLESIIASEDFRTYAAQVLGIGTDDLENRTQELAAQLADNSGISMEDAVAEVTLNMAVMYAADGVTAMDEGERKAFLTDPASKQILSNNLSNEATRNTGFTQAVLVYGMYTAFAYSSEDDSRIAKLDSLSIVLNAFDDSEFLAYTADDQGDVDLKGYLAALNMIRECAGNTAAAEALLVAGFNDEVLKEAVQTLLDDLDHTCDRCGPVMSECQWDAGETTTQPSCTEDGVKTMTCAICGAIDTEAIPSTGHTPGEAVQENEVAADCHTEGSYDLVVYCTVEGCGEELSRETKTVAKNHPQYTNGFCTACGEYEAAVLNGNVYEISNAGQLYWFARKVNSGEKSINGKLTADIVINTGDVTNCGGTKEEGWRDWTPIGTSHNICYAGIFDGQNHTVSGLYYNDPAASYIGLFGYVYGGTVTNTGIENSYLSGSLQVGAIAGYSWSATITNCYNAGTVVGCESEYAGGIGGVVGSTYGSNTVSDCYNSGTVTSVAGSVGGIVGYCGNQTSTAEIVTRCYNIGSVSGTECSTGGVVGMIRNKATISYCYNAGTVTHTGTGGAYYGTGGITGLIHDSVGSVTNCVSYGSVSGKLFVGAIVGEFRSGTIKNCYYANGSAVNGSGMIQNGTGTKYSGTQSDTAGRTIGKKADAFTSGEVTWLMNGSTSAGDLIWHQDIGTDSGPVFAGGVVYKVQTGGCNADSYTYGYANEELEPVFSHTEVIDEGTDPTCTETGLTEGSHCSACGEILTNQEEIPSLGHTPSEAVQENETAATCYAEGSYDEVVYCSVEGCGAELSRVAKTIDKAEHTPGEAVRENETPATCYAEGSYDEVVYCSVENCGAEISRQARTADKIDHSWDDGVVTDPSCVEAGYTTYTCTVEECGATKTEDGEPATGIHKDNDGNGKCDTCDTAMKFDISFARMILGNSLAMNFAFAKDSVDDWTGYYVEFRKSVAGGEDKVETLPYSASNWMQTKISGKAYFVIAYNNIAAKEMADDLKVTIYNAQGEAVSNTWTDSVRAYVMRNIDTSTFNAETKVMAVDMLNYGAKAQELLDYNTEDPANNQLTETHKSYATGAVECNDYRVKGNNYLGTRLQLKSNILLDFAFKNVNATMTGKITFTKHDGKAVEVEVPVVMEGGTGVVTVDQIVVADGRELVTVKIYDGNNVVAEAADSIESYVNRMSTGDDLFAMLMRFSDSAYASFH